MLFWVTYLKMTFPFFSKTFTFKSEGNRLLKYPIIFITFFFNLLLSVYWHITILPDKKEIKQVSLVYII